MQKQTLPEDGFAIDISMQAGDSLRIKPVVKDHAKLKAVKYSQPGIGGKVNLSESNGTYTLEQVGAMADSMYEYDYQIEMEVVRTHALTFVDTYAGEHGGTKSVKLLRYDRNSTEGNEGSPEAVDLIGNTVTVAADEWSEFCGLYEYVVEAEEGFTFQTADLNTIRLGIRRILNKTDRRYRFEFITKRPDALPEDITVYVMAEQTQARQLSFQIPEELKDKMQVSVYGRKPNETKSSQLETAADGSVSVPDDMSISFDVALQNGLGHTASAAYQVDGNVEEVLNRDSMNMTEGETGWLCSYSLGTLRDGDVTVKLSQTDVNQITMKTNWEALESITVYEPVYSEYSRMEYQELTELSVYVPVGEELVFDYARRDDYNGQIVVSETEDGSKEIDLQYKEDYGYALTPVDGMTIYLCSKPYEYKFDYLDSDVSVLVYNHDTGEPLELSENNRVSSYNGYLNLRVMVKPLAGKTFSVLYNGFDWEGDSIRPAYAERNDEYDQDGYYCYVIDGMEMADRTVTIQGYDSYTVNFDKKNPNLLLERRYIEEDYGDGEYSYGWDEMVGSSLKMREGEELYFRVSDGYDRETQKLVLELTGSAQDALQPYWDMETESSIYRLVPTADTTVTIQVTDRVKYAVTINVSENVKNYEATVDYTNIEDFKDPSQPGRYLVREDSYVRIGRISDVTGTTGRPSEGKRGKVILTMNGETYEAPTEYIVSEDNEMYIRIPVTGDMTLDIDVVPVAQHTLSVADADKMDRVRVWRYDSETGEASDILYQNGTATLDDNQFYWFDFQLKEGLIADSVVLRDKTSGQEKILKQRIDDGEVISYPIGITRSDLEIVVNTLSGYTVKFDLSKAPDAEIYKSYISEEPIEGNITSAAADSASFYLANEDEYKLTLDSDAFILKRNKVSSGDGDEYYTYTVIPSDPDNIPSTVTVSVEVYERHKVTLEYPAQIKSIGLSGSGGYTFTMTNKEVSVYGTELVLSVRPVSGYDVTVKIQGTGDEETMEPFRTDGNTKEYYLGELTEDKTIRVTAARSTEKQTYYSVGFLSEGGSVVVREPVHDIQYYVYNDAENYGASYTILKGQNMSFYVEPNHNYMVEGVYANGTVVVPVYDEQSKRDIYTVTPTADTQIKVCVSRIVQKYPVTFAYPDTVSAVTVRDYALQDNRMDVRAGTKVRFSVVLADPKYTVTSVKMNGKDVPYSRSESCYVLTTLAEPMEVVIEAGVEDKTVTFANKAEQAVYTVATGEHVQKKEENVYLVSGLADVLQFTVLSLDKEKPVTVSYTNIRGSKVILQEKDKAESEQGITYTYEIAASDLPVKAEISISRSGSSAEAGDKKELEAAIGQYKDYKEADYTPESWADFTKALKDAQGCLTKEDATQEEIDAAVAALDKAAKALVKAGGEPDPGPVGKEGLWIEEIPDQTYTGSAIKPVVRVWDGDKPLFEEGDNGKVTYKEYSVSYRDNIKAGIATVTVKGKGNYGSSDTKTFAIREKSIEDKDVIMADVVYAVIAGNNTLKNPKVTLKWGKKTLKDNVDYKLTYPNGETKAGSTNPVAGEYKINVEGQGNYTGERSICYKVLANGTIQMSKVKAVISDKTVAYTDGVNNPKPTVTEVSYGSGKNKVPLMEGTHFTVRYENAGEVGKAAVILEAIDGSGYYGEKSIAYTVTGLPFKANRIDIQGINSTGYAYTGSAVEVEDLRLFDKEKKEEGTTNPYELLENRDYAAVYSKNVNAGTATLTLTGKGAYTGKLSKKFKINKLDLNSYKNQGSGLEWICKESAVYTKNGAVPEYTLRFNGKDLALKKEYTITCKKNKEVKPGQKSATMTVKGAGNFTGTVTAEYEVTTPAKETIYAEAGNVAVPAKFSKLKASFKLYEDSTGKALKAGTDYDKTVKYYIVDESGTERDVTDADMNAGQEIGLRITLKGNYAGQAETPAVVETSFRLHDVKMKVSTFKVDKIPDQIYTGKEIEPAVVVKDKDGNLLEKDKHYKLSYSNNIKKGTGKVIITGFGQDKDSTYGGTKTVTFKIKAADMKWVEKTVKDVLDVFSEMMLIPE